jgi:hypothetical protein
MKAILHNFETDFQNDMANGNGFIIDTPVPVDKRGIIRNPKGIYSSLYGGDITDSEELLRRYRCKCGELTGKFRENMICDKCGTPVSFQDNELDKTGWMVLNPPYVLISPIMYGFLKSIFKQKLLDEMISFRHKLDANGVMIFTQPSESKNPYANIGIVEFARRFDEILEVMGNKSKILEIDIVKRNRDKIFTNKIPVLNLLLRPVVLISGTTFNYDPINMFYSEMISYVHYINNNIRNDETNSSLSILYDLQNKWNELNYKIIDQKINGKKHIIRNFILGSRVNFSARHVIVANNDTVSMKSIRLPYLTFCEFYKFHIMNIYKKIYRITVNELQDRWYTLVMTQDPSIMHIIDILIKRTKGGLRILANRNPTLALGSIQVLIVDGVIDDIDDLTVTMPLTILKIFGADFDGDVLSQIPLIDQALANKLEKFYSPERLLVSVTTGLYNQRITLIKDQLVGLYSFCNDPFCAEDFNNRKNNFSIITTQILAARDEYYSAKLQSSQSSV